MAKMMGVPPVKAKGLMKGLKYISQIFDNEKEQEMVIGVPTDVKHVAHIGWDGPATINNNPSWMNEFHSAPLSTTFGPDAKEVGSPKSASQEIPVGGLPQPSAAREEEDGSTKPRRTRRHAPSEVPGSEPPARESRGGSRHTRKHHSTGSAPGSESPSREGESTHRGRRRHKSDTVNGSEPDTLDRPTIPKTKKKERPSRGSDGGSTRSRSKNPSSNAGTEERATQPVEEAV